MRGFYSSLLSQIALTVTCAFLLLAGPVTAQIELAGKTTVNPSFAGVDINQQLTDLSQSAWPPSPNAAVGPEHVVEVVNQSLAIYDRAGTRLSHVRLREFLRLTRNGITHQATFDPRLLFDGRTGRWFIACVASGVGQGGPPEPILLGVSRTSDPTGKWDIHLVTIGEPSAGNTFNATANLSMGIDATGLYFGVRIVSSKAAPFCKIAATKLSVLVANRPSLGAVTQFSNLSGLVAAPQPATNFDAPGSQWFAASVQDGTSGVRLFKLTWNGSTPSLSAPLNLGSPAYGIPVDAPQGGTTTLIETGDQRAQAAVVRNGRLYVSRTIGVNSSGEASAPDRSACEWLEINVSGASPALTQSGRVFQSGIGGRHYYFPTLSVNSASDLALSFSGSSATEFISAYHCGRVHTDAVNTLSEVQTLKAGAALYVRTVGGSLNPFGRYGTVVTDPVDDFSFWTCQNYAAAPANSWGTWIGRVQLSDPPAPPGKAKITPAKLAFGKVKAGSSKARSFTITNKGDNALFGSVNEVEAPYAITAGGGAFNLNRGEKRKVTITFSPLKRGPAPSSTEVLSNDPRGPIQVTLTGSGR